MSATDRSRAFGLRALRNASRAEMLDRLRLRRGAERAVYRATRQGFHAAGVAGRTFTAIRRLGRPARAATAPAPGLFDLTPSDEQQLLQEACRAFAQDVLRPAAAQADRDRRPDQDALAEGQALGLALLGVPEELGGAITQRSAVSAVLVAEALAWGDMGQALAMLAPAGVATALSLWGDAEQQATYLPALLAGDAPAAAVCLLEDGALADPLAPQTTARRVGDGFVLSGRKTFVPRAEQAELLIVSASLDAGPALFLVPAAGAGVLVRGEPAMGLHSAGLGLLRFDDVILPPGALIADGDPAVAADCVRRARLGWCALAVGTAQAVLDYVIPYVNERVAFGEPISHRQSVAFAVSDMAIEVEGMRLATLRAAARADAGAGIAREVAVARSLCERHAMDIASQGVQLLGGHGFVCDHPVERWYRDLRAVGLMEGALLV